jgi:DNA-binding transcriptional LysR family regulator
LEKAMQIQFIESFLQLYKDRNITKASAKLFITQQGLSRQIRSLERELNVSLFDRSRSGVSPTDICEEVFPHLRKVHEEYLAAARTIEASLQAAGKNSVRIAFAIGISNCVNTDFLFDYQKAHKDVRIEIEEWAQPVCVEKLLNGELELAFLVNPIDQKLLRCVPLAEDYMFAAIHRDHPLAAADTPLEFSQLDRENIITGSPDNALRRLFDRYCELTGIKPRIIVSSSYSLNFVNAMTENAGIATVTSAMAARITNPAIVIRRLLTPEPGVMYCCVPLRVERDKERLSVFRYIKDYFETTPMDRFKET